MSDCERARSRLVLRAEHALSETEALEVERHLEHCAECRAEASDVSAICGLLSDPELFLPPDSESWNRLPETVVGSARSPSRSEWKWRPFGKPGRLAWAFGVAAALALAIGLTWTVLRRPGAGPGIAGAEAPGNRAFLERIEALYARGAAAQYLADCQALLLNLVRAQVYCDGDRYDLGIEVERARELLRRKRLLDNELRSPGVASAKDLCDELEYVLLSLSTAENCATPERLRQLEQYIQREQLLLRINILQLELS